MSIITCPQCDTQIDATLSFCGKCGTPILNASQNSAQMLAKALDLTIAGAEIEEQLRAYSEVPGDSAPAILAIAWAFRMRCHARQSRYLEAEQARTKAREFCAKHLNLEGEALGKYLAEESYFMEGEVFEREASINPWLHSLFCGGFELGAPLHGYLGDSVQEKQSNAMRAWASFGDDDVLLQKVLAGVQMRAGQHRQAAEILDRLLRSSDFQSAEIMGRMTEGFFWMNLLAGECYKALGERAEAMNRWQKTRSLERWRDIDADTYGAVGLPWVEKAKIALRQEGIAIPTEENSQAAAQHLSVAWEWMLRAEAELGTVDMSSLGDMLKNPQNDFTKYTLAAANELQIVEANDPFVRVEVTMAEGARWIRYDLVKGQILRFQGLVHLGVDDFDNAITFLKRGVEIRPSLGTYFWLAFCYGGKGQNQEARKIYEMCIAQTSELADFLEDEEEQARTKEIANLLLSEMPTGNITHLYLHKGGEHHGPFPIAQVKAWLSSGQVQPNDLAWYDGASDWAPLDSVPGIYL